MQTKEEALNAGRAKLAEFRAKRAASNSPQTTPRVVSSPQTTPRQMEVESPTPSSPTALMRTPRNSGHKLELEALLTETQAELASLRTELFAQRRIAQEAKTTSAAAAEKAAQMEEQKGLLREAVSTLQRQKELGVQEAHGRGLEEGRAENAQRVADAEATAHRAAQHAADAEERATSAEARAADAESKYEEAKKNSEKALGERTAIAGEREAWHRARESVAAELRLSQKKATMAEEEQLRAEEEASVLREELATLREELERKAFARASDDFPVADDAEARSSQDQMVRMLEDAQGEMLVQLQELRHDCAAHEAAAKAAKERVAALEAEKVVLAAKVAAPVPTSGAEMAATAELERENAALVSRLDAATQSRKRLEVEVAGIAAKLRGTEARLAEAETRLAETEAKLTAAMAQLAAPSRTTSLAQDLETENAQLVARLDVQMQAKRALEAKLAALGSPTAATVVPGAEGEASVVVADASPNEMEARKQVERLEASRRKLLGELDAQSLEIERLFTETARLAEGLRQKQALAVVYEAQLGDSLAQNAKLTDMLTEQAVWPADGEGGKIGERRGETERENARLALELMELKAHSSQLEQKLSELNAQNLQANNLCGDLKQGSIESKLMSMKKARAQFGALPARSG